MVIGILIVLIWGLSLIVLSVWVYRAQPSKDIVMKYPRSVVFKSKVPFMREWKGNVDVADLQRFQEYRKRLFLLFACSAVLLLILYIYLYFRYNFGAI